jgi:hypothetical protein
MWNYSAFPDRGINTILDINEKPEHMNKEKLPACEM